MIFTETSVRQDETVRRVLGEVRVGRSGLEVTGDQQLHRLVRNVSPNSLFRIVSPRAYAWMVAGQFRSQQLQVTINESVDTSKPIGRTREAWHHVDETPAKPSC